jgi:hypothetical protein
MATHDDTPASVRWARLRLQIIGSLLAAPAEDGELKSRIEQLAARPWRHPTTGETIRFSFKTLERWFYAARDQVDPIAALARKVPRHAGTFPSVPAALGEVLREQHREHPRWSFQLHYDNLRARAREEPKLGPIPSYGSICRYMKHHGLVRLKKRKWRRDEGGEMHDDEPTFVPRERRSFEVAHVHGLWHLDFHTSSRAIQLPNGQYKKPFCLGILDDRSRLCCHLQWYLDETTDSLVHALMQAFQKRALPRALLTDNGAAMTAAETTEGLFRLGIVHHTTLPNSPEQNGSVV